MSTTSMGSSLTTTTPSVDVGRWLWLLLRAMGSLKITVAMFAIGTLILFVGTIAQDEETIVDVKKQYFNSWIATVPFDVFQPQTIWPHEKAIPGALAIPGGAAVGLILLINLIAAKLTRFQMNAKGGRKTAGIVLTAIGFGLIALIVVSAHLGDGLQGEPPFSYAWIWFGVKLSAWLLAIGGIAWSLSHPKTRVVRWSVWIGTGIITCVALVLFIAGDAFRIPDPGLRIVWQLTKSLVVSGVLLAGLLLLFGKRGGNVLIHLGVALLMLGQFIFGDAQREERISIMEGQKTLAAYQPDIVELVFIDPSRPDKNRVFAFDDPLLQSSLANQKFLSVEGLPFEFRVDRWMTNSSSSRRKSPTREGDEDHELKGLAQDWSFAEVSKSGGAKSETNIATAYVTLRDKKNQKEIGKYAASQWLNDEALMFEPTYEQVSLDDKTWQMGLRFRRNYKPYSIVLDDVVLEEYTGTAKPKDYSSFVKVLDENGQMVQQGRIWMNNPMRFRGETFYQSGYMSSAQNPLGVEQTTLQVVTNAGWLIPYVSCVLCGLGMLVHFGGTFARFASRYDRNAFRDPALANNTSETETFSRSAPAKKATPKARPSGDAGNLNRWLNVGVPLAIVMVFAGWVISKARVPAEKDNQIHWQRIGEIPTQFGGRIKPLASSAAEVLQMLSNKKYALSKEGHAYEPYQTVGKKIDATHWIMGVFAQEDWIFDSPLIRIDAVEATSALGLTRHTSNRYSFKQIDEGRTKIRDQIDSMVRMDRKKWTFEQQKLAEVLEKLAIFENLVDAYSLIAPKLPSNPTDEDVARLTSRLQGMVDHIRSRNPIGMFPPLVDVTVTPGEKAPPAKWDAFGPAMFDTIKLQSQKATNKKESVLAFWDMVNVYKDKSADASKINAAVAKFDKKFEEEFGSAVRGKPVAFEAWYERFDPINLSLALYVCCGLFALFSFVIARVPMKRTAFWLCVLAVGVHTVAIVSRVYISGRPPVVSLYSAAVFIGWAIVLFCVVTEVLFPLAVSIVMASIAGFLTLNVAHSLDIGDSMPVLEAVLDTQFWLSTHVISVSLGYSATFLAGALGIEIVVAMWYSKVMGSKPTARVVQSHIPTLYRICYGIVCFGLFFSFVGTVLGGLWGDDSWGRFWGWDPKENGAMMIVLWNALLLHARWDKMIGPLGFANLAIVGNIITAWSMFGTNLLGVGLHSYGFNKETLNYLIEFVLSQLVFVAAGLILVILGRGGVAPAEPTSIEVV